MATAFAIILYFFDVYYELRPEPATHAHFDAAFPVFRLMLSITFAWVCWSWVLHTMVKQRINYLYVWELPQTITVSWIAVLEFSLFLIDIVLLAGVLHLRFDIAEPYYGVHDSYTSIAPFMLPISILVVVLNVVYPPRAVLRVTRAAFFKVLSRCMTLPFGYVRFVEFFVADWGTSLPQPCADLVFTVCFYTAGAKYAFGDGAWHSCSDVAATWNYPVTAIPFIWRACQTLKMFLRTKNRAHLVNHGKYQSFLLRFAFDWMCAVFGHNDTTRFFSEFFRFAAELYAFVWDVLMDWGFIRGRQRERMFKNGWVYVAATIFDLFAHVFYLPADWIVPYMSADWMVTFQALLEIFRRAIWSIFRIENENVNNLETYRSIDLVPEVTLPEHYDE
jgi:hypothetical protein